MNEVKQPKKQWITYMLLVIVVMILLNSLVMPSLQRAQITETDYNTFITMTENDQVKEVQISSSQILFTDTDDPAQDAQQSDHRSFFLDLIDPVLIRGLEIQLQNTVQKRLDHALIHRQEVFENIRITDAEALVRIVDARQLIDRMTRAERIHIDQQRLILILHDVLDVQIAVQHGACLGDHLDQRAELSELLRIKAALCLVEPLTGDVAVKRYPNRRLSFVQCFCQFDRLLRNKLDLCRILLKQLGKGPCVDQLKDRAVSLPYLDDPEGDRGGNSQNKSRAGHIMLRLDMIEGIRLVVHLDDGIVINTVDHAVSALTDDLFTGNVDTFQRSFDRHHLRKAGHL